MIFANAKVLKAQFDAHERYCDLEKQRRDKEHSENQLKMSEISSRVDVFNKDLTQQVKQAEDSLHGRIDSLGSSVSRLVYTVGGFLIMNLLAAMGFLVSHFLIK
jgi:chromosome segregation ATPase